MTKFNGDWQNEQLSLDLGDTLGKITLATAELDSQPASVTLYYTDTNLIGVQTLPKGKKVTRSLQIKTPGTIESQYLARFIVEKARENGLKVNEAVTDQLPHNQQQVMQNYWEKLTPIISVLGFNIKAAKKRPAKAQHRWNTKIAKVAFTTHYEDTEATVYWRKRNEVVILAGAKMKPQPELNANGELGFSARFAAQLRQENAAAFDETFTTTKEIVLKSVNEVGLFLYFGNTNSWLQLKDENGRTIDDWTIVKQ